MLNFCDFIQVYVFTTNHHLKEHGDPTDMRESTSVFQIRTINWSILDK